MPGAQTGPPPCEICSALKDRETATQKFGWEEQDTHLPAAAGRLVVARDFSLPGSRAVQLWRCPLCGTHYLYRADYTYLANGSEDEQSLTRLTAQEAAAYLEDAGE